MSDFFNRRLNWVAFGWLALVVWFAYKQYLLVVTDPDQAALLNDATGVFLNIILVGVALMGAALFLLRFLRKQAGRWF